MPGPGDPNDKPGIEHIIAIYKAEFGAAEWKSYFMGTVKVNLNYEYKDSSDNGH